MPVTCRIAADNALSCEKSLLIKPVTGRNGKISY